MAKRDKEEKLKEICILKLKHLEQDYEVKVNEKIKVLSDLTCIKEGNAFKLAMGFAEVDVAIYKQILFDKSNSQLINYFKFIQDSRQDKNYLSIPFIILELKSGTITTDAIRARNEVARKIKDVFPFCSYIFIGDKTSKKKETLFRQGKNFNNFFIFEGEIDERDISNVISQFIKPYLDNLKEINLL